MAGRSPCPTSYRVKYPKGTSSSRKNMTITSDQNLVPADNPEIPARLFKKIQTIGSQKNRQKFQGMHEIMSRYE